MKSVSILLVVALVGAALPSALANCAGDWQYCGQDSTPNQFSCCNPDFSCTVINQWHHQCEPTGQQTNTCVGDWQYCGQDSDPNSYSCCNPGHECKYINQWHYQCEPANSGNPPAPSSGPAPAPSPVSNPSPAPSSVSGTFAEIASCTQGSACPNERWGSESPSGTNTYANDQYPRLDGGVAVAWGAYLYGNPQTTPEFGCGDCVELSFSGTLSGKKLILRVMAVSPSSAPITHRFIASRPTGSCPPDGPGFSAYSQYVNGVGTQEPLSAVKVTCPSVLN